MSEAVESLLDFVYYTLCMRYILCVPFTKKKSRLTIAILLVIFSLFCEVVQLGGENEVILWMFLSAAAFILLFNDRISFVILKFFCVFFGFHFLSFPIEIALSILYRHTGFLWLDTYGTWLKELISSVLLILLIYFLHKNPSWKTIVTTSPLWIYVTSLLFSICASGLNSLVFIYGDQMSIHGRTLFEIICVCFSEFIALFGIDLLLLRNLKEQYRKETILKTEYMTVSRQYYHSLLEKIEESRKLRHDMKAHLSLLNVLLEQDNVSQAKSYLSEIAEQEAHTEIAMIDVGNELVNAILSTEKMKMPKDITFHCEGRLFPETTAGLSDFELCVIFTNLISNAREACEQLRFHEKEIFLRIKQNQGRLIIQTENPVEWEIDSDRIMQKNMHFQEPNNAAVSRYTTKANAENHGYGLQNVKEIVDRHHGRFQFEVKEDRVIVSVLL